MRILIWHHGVTILTLDTFTDANGTGLAAHHMNVGSGWTQRATVGQVVTIQANQASFNPNGILGDEVWTVPTTQSNGTIIMSFQLGNSAGAGTAGGPVLRFQDINNDTMLQAFVQGSEFAIYEKVSGSFLRRASATVTISSGTPYTVVVVFSGPAVTATLNGANMITYGSLSTNLQGTTHGVRLTGDTTNLQLMTRFEVTNP
jgi:hypothetical protein